MRTERMEKREQKLEELRARHNAERRTAAYVAGYAHGKIKTSARGKKPPKEKDARLKKTDRAGKLLVGLAVVNFGFAAARYVHERREVLRAVSDDEGVKVILLKNKKADRPNKS